jgi:hypothetical protein
MRVQSMPARSADSCAAFIRMTPSTMGGPFEAAAIERLPIHHEATAIPHDNLHGRRASHGRPPPRVMAQCLPCQMRQAIRTLPEVHRLGRHVNHKISGSHQHERVRRSAINTSLSTARPGAPRTSTRAPSSSTVTAAASGDKDRSAAASREDSDTNARTIVYPPKPAAPIDPNAPCAANHALAVAGNRGGAQYL